MISEAVPRRTPKVPRDYDDDEERNLNGVDGQVNHDGDKLEDDHQQITKAKRHDIEVPISEVDMKLVKKLDSILNISDTRKPRFFTNKPKVAKQTCFTEQIMPGESSDLGDGILLKHKNLTKDQLKQRLLEKYDTLVPELDPKRPTVKVIEVLSASESLELARGEAKKQMEHQFELGSIRSNQIASKRGINSFRSKDEESKSNERQITGSKPGGHKGKSVSFAPNEQNDGVMAEVKFFKPDESEASSSKGWWSFHSRFTANNDYDDDEEEDDDEDDEDEDDDDDDDDNYDHSENEEDSGNGEEDGGGIGIYMSKPDATRKPK